MSDSQSSVADKPLSLSVSGMRCGGCASKLERAIVAVPGVDRAKVSHATGVATVDWSPTEPLDVASVVAAIESAGDYRTTERTDAGVSKQASRQPPAEAEPKRESLYPLFLIVGFIAGVTVLVSFATGTWSLEPMMRHFMAGFFIVFSFFKFLDPPGFVSAYRSYDIVAAKVPVWGWVYPFVELGLGVAYLLALAPVVTNAVTLALMLVGAVGVLSALLAKRTIRCACLGTALNLPMTKVTLIEDLTMAAMAAAMLWLLLAA